MKMKSSTLQLSLIGCLSFLHLTSHAGQLSPRPNNLSSSAVAASSAKITLRPTVQKESISNKLNPAVNFNELYSNVKSGKAATTKIEGGIAAGGGAIILYPDARNGKIKAKAVEIYQITEGSAKSKFTLDTGPGQTLQEKIDYVLKRLSKASGLHAEMYGTWIQDILTNPNEADDFSDVTLPRVEDLGVAILPPGGIPVQVFIQQVPGELSLVTNGPSKRYLWNKKLFYSLDLDSQVALLFHEVIYRDYREVNKNKIASVAMNSQKVQYATAMILSKEMDQYFINYKTDEKYGAKFKSDEKYGAKVEHTNFQNMLLKLNLMHVSECVSLFNVADEIKSFASGDDVFYYHRQPCDNLKNNDSDSYYLHNSSHYEFERRISSRLHERLQLGTMQLRNLDFLGIRYSNYFGIGNFSREKITNSQNFLTSLEIGNFKNDLNYLDITDLVNHFHDRDLGIKIVLTGNEDSSLEIKISNDGSIKYLAASRFKGLSIIINNYRIEIPSTQTDMRIDFSRNDYKLSVVPNKEEQSSKTNQNRKLRNIVIYNPEGRIIAENVYGVVDFSSTESITDPTQILELYQITKTQGLFSEKVKSQKINLKEIISNYKK